MDGSSRDGIQWAGKQMQMFKPAVTPSEVSEVLVGRESPGGFSASTLDCPVGMDLPGTGPRGTRFCTGSLRNFLERFPLLSHRGALAAEQSPPHLRSEPVGGVASSYPVHVW